MDTRVDGLIAMSSNTRRVTEAGLPHPRPLDGKTSRNLNYLRAIAAGSVALNHGIEVYFPAYLDWQYAWVSPGRMGVVTFFLISGYLFCEPRLQGKSVKRFLTKRFWRIMPTYWVALAVFATFDFRNLTSLELLGNLTLTHVLFGAQAVVPPSWTLPIEFIFYFTVCAAILLQRSLVIVYFCFSVCTAAALTFAVAAGIGGPSTVPALVCIALFAGAYRIVLHRPLAAVCAVATLIANLVLATLHQTSSTDATAPWTGFSYLASIGLGVAIFYLYLHFNRRTSASLAYLGTVSYSLYLIHPLCYEFSLVASSRTSIGLILYVSSCALAATILYYLVELPTQRLVSRKRRIDQ